MSEVAGINIEDLDMNKALVRVIRKGNKEQYVYFSKQALLDVENYLQIRESRYIPEKKRKLSVYCSSRWSQRKKSTLSYFSDKMENRKAFVWPFLMVGAVAFYASYWSGSFLDFLYSADHRRRSHVCPLRTVFRHYAPERLGRRHTSTTL
ncbi:site-specific tyrosine recombinase XerS [Paenibacillus terrae HPL-003]|uniref:Site-specific tyrosine recombinase XerS n=1 Tax=Paenibacillus terrae (strain HPL-003) TaxID=985665 RepID=G7VP73_PAETH|nr:site-specific tyrosine recombinase XerS [Paenibacillus terrae HPL-003]